MDEHMDELAEHSNHVENVEYFIQCSLCAWDLVQMIEDDLPLRLTAEITGSFEEFVNKLMKRHDQV